MQKLSKVLIGTGILAFIVMVGVLVGWLGSRVSPNSGKVQPGASSMNSNLPPAASSRNPAETATGANLAAPSMPEIADANMNLATNWEDKVDGILGEDDDDTNKVVQLLAIFPALPEEGQEEVAQHLSNLLDDEDYAPLGELLKNAALPESVLDALMADVLNRPNATKLPMFLELARNPNHPKAEEARDLLELYLDEDYGDNWGTWREKVQEWLKDNPD